MEWPVNSSWPLGTCGTGHRVERRSRELWPSEASGRTYPIEKVGEGRLQRLERIDEAAMCFARSLLQAAAARHRDSPESQVGEQINGLF